MKAGPTGAEAGNGHCRASTTSPADIDRSSHGFPRDATFAEHCKDLARARLNGPACKLFSEQTGTPLRLIWAPPGELNWNQSIPVFQTNQCHDGPTPVSKNRQCILTDTNRLMKLLGASVRSIEFTCPSNIRTIARKIQVEDLLLGIAFIQINESRPRVTEQPHTKLQRLKNLLHFVVHDAEETVRATIGREMLTRLQDELTARRNLEIKLKSTIHLMTPGLSREPMPDERHSHRELIVSRMLDYANEHYDEAIGLDCFARQVQMNRSYLSHLFSKIVGLPFRSYLKQLRMDRALKLLSQPELRISDIAFAVGYNDPNRFRLDFKEHTGLAPSRWRARTPTRLHPDTRG